MTNMLNKIEGVTLLVSDIKRSVEFYRDILNLRVNQESEDKIEFSKKGSTNTKLIIELDKTGSNQNNNKNSVIITFSVMDLNTLYDNLVQRKVNFHKKLSDDETGKNTIIRDPDGYLISLTEPVDEFAQIPYYHGFAPA